MFSRRGFVQAALVGLMVPVVPVGQAWAEAPDRSPRPVPRGGMASADGLVAAAKLTGVVSFVVMDADSGAVLEARAPDQPVPPASVAKAVTALYALEILGPDYRFATQVLAAGTVQNGVPLEDFGGGQISRDDFSWEGGGTLPQNRYKPFMAYEKLLCKKEPY